MILPLFDEIKLLSDTEPHSAAMNMALDETLLRQAETPVLRVYQWKFPAVSFGYFEKIGTVERLFPDFANRSDRELIRRWTGGGVVPHSADGADFTYSLILPKTHHFSKMRSADSYREIHERVTAALQQSGVKASLTVNAPPKISQACFENPVPHDIIVSGKKIAGAAQRRSRFGALHQGSIQLDSLPAHFPKTLAKSFAERIAGEQLSAITISEAGKLAAEKYATQEWLRKL